MEIEIKSANEKNMSELISLFTEVCRETGIELESKQKDVEQMFIRAIANNHKFFIARINGENVGYVWLSTDTHKWNRKKFCILHDMIVKKAFRQKGLDKEMISVVKEFAKKENCNHIHAELPIENMDSSRLLEHSGFETTHKVLTLKL